MAPETDEPMGGDAAAMAVAAGLRYCTDEGPGITRLRCGRGFRYLDAARGGTGRSVGDATLERIRDLVIPPAWTDVWISRDPESHLQATGRDDRDRKQYLYHPRWREFRDDAKFAQLADFPKALIEIRRRVDSDLARTGLDRRRMIAAVVRLLDTSLIRVGNERYAAENDTFGATTLERRHVRGVRNGVRLDFTGKSGVERILHVHEPALVAAIRGARRADQPQLFCYRNDRGDVVDMTSVHVNDYLTAIAGPVASAKTFRTWGATVHATHHLCEHTDPASPVEKRIVEAIDAAAEELGNTRAVCRNCYVAPTITVAAESGELERAWRRSRSGRWLSRAESTTAKVLVR